jgi:hypothetical protein
VITASDDAAAGLHHVARIDQPQSYLTGDRRGDMAVVQLQLVVLHGARGRSFTVPSVLLHQLFLVATWICSAMALRARARAVAFKIHLRLGQYALVVAPASLRLQQRGRIGRGSMSISASPLLTS